MRIEVNEQAPQHGQFHLAGLDLLTQILRSSPHHQAGEKDADDQVNEHVDQSHAFAAKDAIEHHAGHRRDPRQRIQAVVHAIDRAAGDGRGHCRKGGACGRPEAQLFPFEVAQSLLVDGQRRNGGDDFLLRSAWTSTVDAPCAVNAGFGFMASW